MPRYSGDSETILTYDYDQNLIRVYMALPFQSTIDAFIEHTNALQTMYEEGTLKKDPRIKHSKRKDSIHNCFILSSEIDLEYVRTPIQILSKPRGLKARLEN